MEDSDWLIGRLRGQQGVVPMNLITEVTDPQEIKRYKTEFSAPSVPHSRQQHWQQDNARTDSLSTYTSSCLLFVCLFVCLFPVYCLLYSLYPLDSTGRKMKALYDYDPVEDSPNGPEAALVSCATRENRGGEGRGNTCPSRPSSSQCATVLCDVSVLSSISPDRLSLSVLRRSCSSQQVMLLWCLAT